MRKKFENERDKLVKLNLKKKDIKAQAIFAQQKETRTIDIAKERFDIDF